MELYQIRYFLAVSRTLNFTRAAEECHVSQPALTRAVQKLEQELGGALFRREGRRTHLTDLGRAMMPPLQQSLEAAELAKEQAESYGRGDIAPLRIGLSESVPLPIFMPLVEELSRAYPGLRLDLTRGDAEQVMTLLEEGAVEVALTAVDGETWSRIDGWPLYSEDVRLCVSRPDGLADRDAVPVQDIGGMALISRRHCETNDVLVEHLKSLGVDVTVRHSLDRDTDFSSLIASGEGVGIVPRTTAARAGGELTVLPISGLDFQRTVSLFAVAGRRYSTAAAGLIRLARSADWAAAVDGAGASTPPARPPE